MPKVHEVKCRQPHFDDVASGRKTAELRFDDRGYQVGDTLRLREIAGRRSGDAERHGPLARSLAAGALLPGVPLPLARRARR